MPLSEHQHSLIYTVLFTCFLHKRVTRLCHECICWSDEHVDLSLYSPNMPTFIFSHWRAHTTIGGSEPRPIEVYVQTTLFYNLSSLPRWCSDKSSRLESVRPISIPGWSYQERLKVASLFPLTPRFARISLRLMPYCQNKLTSKIGNVSRTRSDITEILLNVI